MPQLDSEIVTAAGRRLSRRATHRNPASPACLMHLRRICGACDGFPAGADMRAREQKCGRLQVTVNGTQSAATCKHWARKIAAPETKPNEKENSLGQQ